VITPTPVARKRAKKAAPKKILSQKGKEWVKHRVFAGDSLANQFIRPATDFDSDFDPNNDNNEPLRSMHSPTPEEVKKLWRDRPWNTQRASIIRSDINDSVEIYDIPCLRYTREISNFPHLQYWTSPNSIAGKYGDCVRKHGFCYKVGSILDSYFKF
jgi:hypothetical protein